MSIYHNINKIFCRSVRVLFRVLTQLVHFSLICEHWLQVTKGLDFIDL